MYNLLVPVQRARRGFCGSHATPLLTEQHKDIKQRVTGSMSANNVLISCREHSCNTGYDALAVIHMLILAVVRRLSECWF